MLLVLESSWRPVTKKDKALLQEPSEWPGGVPAVLSALPSGPRSPRYPLQSSWATLSPLKIQGDGHSAGRTYRSDPRGSLCAHVSSCACELVCTARCFRSPNLLPSHSSCKSPSPSVRLLDNLCPQRRRRDGASPRLQPLCSHCAQSSLESALLLPWGAGPASSTNFPNWTWAASEHQPAGLSWRLAHNEGPIGCRALCSATANALELLHCIHLSTYRFTISFISHQACTEYSLYAKSRKQWKNNPLFQWIDNLIQYLYSIWIVSGT